MRVTALSSHDAVAITVKGGEAERGGIDTFKYGAQPEGTVGDERKERGISFKHAAERPSASHSLPIHFVICYR